MRKKFPKSLGLLRDPIDKRDIPLSAARLAEVSLPPEISYLDQMPPVRDQGRDGACTAFASTAMKGQQEYKECGEWIPLSPRNLYDEAKKIDGSPNSSGTYLRIVMKVLQEQGVCLESCCPYRDDGPVTPCAEWKSQAEQYKIASYVRLANLDEIKAALAHLGPVVIGVPVFNNWTSPEGGHIGLPAKYERTRGGHAICVFGYSDPRQEIFFQNSWGAGWGDQGHGYLSYEFINKHLWDAWSSVDIVLPHD